MNSLSSFSLAHLRIPATVNATITTCPSSKPTPYETIQCFPDVEGIVEGQDDVLLGFELEYPDTDFPYVQPRVRYEDPDIPESASLEALAITKTKEIIASIYCSLEEENIADEEEKEPELATFRQMPQGPSRAVLDDSLKMEDSVQSVTNESTKLPPPMALPLQKPPTVVKKDAEVKGRRLDQLRQKIKANAANVPALPPIVKKEECEIATNVCDITCIGTLNRAGSAFRFQRRRVKIIRKEDHKSECYPPTLRKDEQKTTTDNSVVLSDFSTAKRVESRENIAVDERVVFNSIVSDYKLGIGEDEKVPAVLIESNATAVAGNKKPLSREDIDSEMLYRKHTPSDYSEDGPKHCHQAIVQRKENYKTQGEYDESRNNPKEEFQDITLQEYMRRGSNVSIEDPNKNTASIAGSRYYKNYMNGVAPSNYARHIENGKTRTVTSNSKRRIFTNSRVNLTKKPQQGYGKYKGVHTEFPETHVITEKATSQSFQRPKVSPYALPVRSSLKSRKKAPTADFLAKPQYMPLPPTEPYYEDEYIERETSKKLMVGVSSYHNQWAGIERRGKSVNYDKPSRSTVVFNNNNKNSNADKRNNFNITTAFDDTETETTPATGKYSESFFDWGDSMLFKRILNGELDICNTLRGKEIISESDIVGILNGGLKGYKKSIRSKLENTLYTLCTDLNIECKVNPYNVTEEYTDYLLEKCQELHKLRRKLIPVFILVSEREKRINRDIQRLLSSPKINEPQQRYLESLVQGLSGLTKKLIAKIAHLQYENPLIGDIFAINGTDYIEKCKEELDEIMDTMEGRFGRCQTADFQKRIYGCE